MQQMLTDKSKKPVLGMILKGFPRISETFISNEILRLEQLGFSIRIFSMRQPREKFSHHSVKQIKAQVDYLPETLVLPLPKFLFFNLWLAMRRPKRYGRTMALAMRRFMRTRKPATLKHLLQAGYLVQRLLPKAPVVHLHAHFAHSPTSVALFASMLSGLAFSFTAHAKDIYTSDSRQLREKLQMARFAVTCTEYNRAYLNRLTDGNGAPIYRIYHGIDTALFSNGDRFNRRRQDYHQLLTVARLIAKKGLPTVYQAIRRLRDQGLAVKHTLIGDGEDREKILALIKHLRLESCSEWLGTQPHHVVMDHYRRADLFVLGCEIASNGDRDGIPNVLLESMAMAVPVVATQVSAIPELVDNGRTGLLVPPQVPEQLAQAIRRILNDRPLRRKIIRNAQERIHSQFDNQALVRELARIFEQAVPPLKRHPEK
jgi:glycosyltransferase involved in cell wall biosynthesis